MSTTSVKRPIDASLVGLELASREWSWTERDLIIYALGLGATVETDLDHLYEQRGPKPIPAFGTTAGTHFVQEQFAAVDMDPSLALHADETIVLHRELPPRATVTTSRRVVDVFDKGSAAVIVWESVTGDGDGPIFTTRGSVFVRGAGGFGGERGPSSSKESFDREPDLVRDVETSTSQAALFRLSGDDNPLHIDPAVATAGGYERPILHGMCTYGIAAHFIGRQLEERSGKPVRRIYARLTAPVLPGDRLHVRGWLVGDTDCAFEVQNGRGEIVLGQGRLACGDYRTESGS